MRPGVPWNVKGIEAEAREFAQQAARRAGVSLGEWLSGLIMEGRGGPTTGYPQSQSQAYPQADAYGPPAEAPMRAPVSSQAFAQGPSGRYPQALAQAYPEALGGQATAGALAYAPQPAPYPQGVPAGQEAVLRRPEPVRPQLAPVDLQLGIADLAALTNSVRDLGDRVERTEMRAEQAIQSVNQSVASMQERIDAAERVKQLADAAFSSAADALAQSARDQSKVFESLEASVRHVQERLSDIEDGQASWPGQESIGRLEVALDQLQSRLVSADTERSQLASRDTVDRLEASLQQLQKRLASMEVAVGNSPDKAAVSRLEETISSMRGEVADADRRTREDMTHMAKYMRDLSQRVESAERNSLATEGLGARLDTLDARSTSMFDEIRGQMSAMDARLVQATSPQNTISPAAFAALKGSVEGIAARLDEMGSQSTQPLVNSIASVESKLGALASKIEASDQRTMESVGGVNSVLRSLTARLEDSDKRQVQAINALNRRMDESDQRADAGVRDLNDSLERALDDFGRRLDTSETANKNAISAVRLTVDGLVARAAERAEPVASQPVRQTPADAALNALRGVMPPADAGAGGLPPFATGQAGPQVRDFPSELPPFLDELPEAGSFSSHLPRGGDGEDQPREGVAEDFLTQARRAALAQSKADAVSTARGSGRQRGAAEAPQRDPSAGGRNPTRLVVLGLAILAISVGLVFILMTVLGRPGGDSKIADDWRAQPEAAVPAETKSVEAPAAPAGILPIDEGEPTDPMVGADPSAVTAPEVTEGDSAETIPGGLMSGTSALPERSKKEAEVAILEAASVRGDAKAQFLLSLRYSEGRGVVKDDARAAALAAKSAEQGFAMAQYRMGALAERGVGVGKSIPQAKAWYEKAAKLGNRKAMHNLAVLLADAEGGAQNYAEAARWFREGATHGLTDSQYNLAVLLEQGMGVPKNLQEATTWYAVAAAQGDTGAAERLDALKKSLPSGNVTVALEAARKFQPRALNAEANELPSMP
jgi:localization factor PodJL